MGTQGAASAVKGQHLCVCGGGGGLHQQLKNWERLPHGGGGEGQKGHQKQHNTRKRRYFIETEGRVISQEWSCPQFSSFRVNVRHGLQLTSLHKWAQTIQFSRTEKGRL